MIIDNPKENGDFMVNGLIIEKVKQFKYYTFMDEILPLLGEYVERYNWLITAVECNVDTSIFQYDNANKSWGNYYIEGRQLLAHLMENKVQFIWGVFSAIPKGTNLSEKELLAQCEPWADGYTLFWKNPLSIQHPMADIEIVAWDSSLTLILAKDFISLSQVYEEIEGARNLESYNNEPSQ